LIFGTLLNIDKPEHQKDKFSLKGAWSRSRDPYKIWHSLEHISITSKATELKFQKPMHMKNFSKVNKQKSKKGAWPRSRDRYEIWHTLKYIGNFQAWKVLEKSINPGKVL